MNRLPVLILILLLTVFLIFSCSDKSAPETESSGYESDQSVNSSEYSSEEGGNDMEEVFLNINLRTEYKKRFELLSPVCACILLLKAYENNYQ